MSALIQHAPAPAMPVSRHPRAGNYGYFVARALVRSSEIELDFLRQCEADLHTQGRAESILAHLPARRARLADIIAQS